MKCKSAVDDVKGSIDESRCYLMHHGVHLQSHTSVDPSQLAEISGKVAEASDVSSFLCSFINKVVHYTDVQHRFKVLEPNHDH